MNLQFAPADGARQGHPPEGLARPAPERLHRTETGTETDADLRLGAVVGRDVHRRQFGLQPRQVRRIGVRARTGTGGDGDPAFRVQRPLLLALAPAQDLHGAGYALPGIGQQHLQTTAGFRAAVGIIGLRQDERAVHLEIFDDRRPRALGPAGA